MTNRENLQIMTFHVRILQQLLGLQTVQTLYAICVKIIQIGSSQL